MMTAKDRMAEIAAKMEALRKEMTQQAGILLRECAQDIFNAYPAIKSFGWTQYTPYYNDGDTCTFGVRSDWDGIYINGEALYDIGQHEQESFEVPAKDIEILLRALPDETLEAMFGDHVLVTVSRNGETTVDSYSHD